MIRRLIDRNIDPHENHVRCLIHPVQVKERDNGERKFQDAALMPSKKNPTTISMHRQQYTTEEKLVAHGEHLCKPGSDQRFSGFLILSKNVVNSVNQWLHSSFGHLNGYDYAGSHPGAEIKYAPMIDDETYYEGNEDLYTDTPGIQYPHHTDLTYEKEFAECKTLNRQYAHELQKRAKLQFTDAQGKLGSALQEKIFQLFDKKPLLSIIIPFHKERQFIRQCAESIYSEVINKPVEVIWVNDGSTDHTDEIVEEYVEKYSGNSYMYSQDNKGQGIARNNGMSVARGEFVWFVDADDKISKGSIDIILKSIDERHDAYMFRTEECHDDNKIMSPRRRYLETSEPCSISGIEILLQKLSFSPSLMFVFRRESLLNRELQFSTFRNIDIDFMPLFLLSNVTIKVVPQIIYTYYFHGKKMQPRQYRDSDSKELLEVYDRNKLFFQKNADTSVRQALLHVQQMIIVHVICDINKNKFPHRYAALNLSEREKDFRAVIKANNYWGNSPTEWLFWLAARIDILLAKKWFG
jgi:glycosyltransferase involved in cell wall biosynthesis